jgi:hypothetical protein
MIQKDSLQKNLPTRTQIAVIWWRKHSAKQEDVFEDKTLRYENSKLFTAIYFAMANGELEPTNCDLLLFQLSAIMTSETIL